MNNRRWTNLELLTLSDLYRDGLSYNEIACKMNRTEPAVASAVMKYRDVINIEYRAKGRGRTKAEAKAPAPQAITADTPLVDMTPPKKPWWKFWA
jgi:hypothetical protein